jgi:oligopeptide transport system permease protein
LIRYLLRRLGHGGLSLAAVYALTFVMVILAPGNPFQSSERRMPDEVAAALRARYNIDQPLSYFFQYAWGVVTRLDFGPSFQYRDWTVNDILTSALPVSLTVGFLALLIALLAGLPMGVVGAMRRGTWLDHLGSAIVLGCLSLPAFVSGSVLLLIFAVWLQALPVGGWGGIEHLLLPAVSLALPFTAHVARLTRVAMLEVLDSEFILAARARGVPRHRVVWRHGFRNAFLPILSYLGPASAYALTGSFVVERVFNVPGLGTYFVQSVQNLDRGLIMGVVLTFSALLIALNLAVDLLYVLVDPRIRVE